MINFSASGTKTQMHKSSMSAQSTTLRPFNIEIGDDEWLKLWSQRKDIQEISDDSSITISDMDEEVLERNAIQMIEHYADTVGCVSMMYDNNRSSVTLGIVIAEPENRKRGIGSSALSKTLEQIRKDKKIKMVHAYVYRDNYAAVRLFEKHFFEIAGQVLFKRKATLHYTLKLQ